MATYSMAVLLCEALGLDSANVARIHFDWDAKTSRLGAIDITLLIRDEQGKAIGELLKHYHLVENEG